VFAIDDPPHTGAPVALRDHNALAAPGPPLCLVLFDSYRHAGLPGHIKGLRERIMG
jgi:hypothetical protein